METVKELFEKDKTLFKNLTPSQRIQLIESTNREIPPEECGLPLTENEKKAYMLDLEALKEERRNNPGATINYEIKYSWFD